MNYKQLLLLVFLSVIVEVSLFSQTIVVNNHQNTATYSLKEIGKIVFLANNLNVTRKSGEIYSFALADIRYIGFGLNTSIDDEIIIKESTGIAEIFQNPAINIITVQFKSGLKSVGNIQIFSIDGKHIITKAFKVGQLNYQINVSDISKGLYVCKICDGNNVELKKFIKL